MKEEQNKPGSLLIVDDTPTNLEILVDFFSEQGFDVLVAMDGESAIEQIAHARPELILLDVMMPGIDGSEICKVMRSDAEMVDTPIIFISAMAPDMLHNVAEEAGASDYMSKPLHIKDLLTRVMHYFERDD